MSSPLPLLPNVFYHIYTRGNNRENIFMEELNYQYFLELYAKHIDPVAETYAYCLLKNHFHLLIKTNEVIDPKDFSKSLGSRSESMAFSNLLNAYAKAINKTYGRTGSLFQHPFGRNPIDSQEYLLQVVRYIHFNPQKHGLTGDFREWPHSSYQACLSTRRTKLRRNDVLEWFGGRKGFLDAHQMPLAGKKMESLVTNDYD